jgi:hypothetical protein
MTNKRASNSNDKDKNNGEDKSNRRSFECADRKVRSIDVMGI